MAAEDDTEEENAVDAGASESETKAKDLKMKVDRSVLATGILDFRADVSKVESDKIVRFQLSTQNGTKEIETLHSVSLRNTVEVKKPADVTPGKYKVVVYAYYTYKYNNWNLATQMNTR